MGGRRYSLWVRRMAVEAWILAGKPAFNNLAVAVKLFRGMVPLDERPRNASGRFP